MRHFSPNHMHHIFAHCIRVILRDYIVLHVSVINIILTSLLLEYTLFAGYMHTYFNAYAHH